MKVLRVVLVIVLSAVLISIHWLLFLFVAGLIIIRYFKKTKSTPEIETMLENTDTEDQNLFREFETNVVGISFPNPDGSSREKIVSKCRRGQELFLEHEPDNLYDKNAVKILNHKEQQLGYLSSYEAKNTRPILTGTSTVYEKVTAHFVEANYFERDDGETGVYCTIRLRKYYKKQKGKSGAV